MTLRTLVCAAVALLVVGSPSSSQALPSSAPQPDRVVVTPGSCTYVSGTSSTCDAVPASSKVSVVCSAVAPATGMVNYDPIDGFTLTVSGGTLASGAATMRINIAPNPAKGPASQAFEWTTPAAGPVTATCVAHALALSSPPYQALLATLTAAIPQPQITAFSRPAGMAALGASLPLSVTAVDPSGTAVSYAWSASAGTITGSGSSVTWTAPDAAGSTTVSVTVTNGAGGQAVRTEAIDVLVGLYQGDLQASFPVPQRVTATPSGELAAAGQDGAFYLLTRDGRVLAAPAMTEKVVAVAGAPGLVYASTDAGSILAIEVETGHILRRYPLGIAKGPVGLAWDDAHQLLWMVHQSGGLQALRANGALAVSIDGEALPQLKRLTDVAYDARTSTVWVAQSTPDSSTAPMVHAFDVTGQYLRSVSTAASTVKVAGGLAIDATSHVYVSDVFSGLVQVYSAQGAAAGTLGTYGTAAGQLLQPYGVTVISNGDLVVADVANGRLNRFGAGAALPACAGDADCDGISDAVELAKGYDPNDATDALRDDDADGLTNRQELALGTDPRLKDSDGDGFSDGEELASGYDPRDPTDHQARMLASGPAGAVEPGEVRLSGLMSGTNCQPSWRQVGGPAVTLKAATSLTPSFVARAGGTYTFEGQATCAAATSAPAQVAVVVKNVAPRADADRVAVVSAGDRADLSAALSSDANGDALSFGWAQTAGASMSATPAGPALAVRTSAPGYHAFRVTAADAGGAQGTVEIPVMVVDALTAVPTSEVLAPTLAGGAGDMIKLDATPSLGASVLWRQVAGPAVTLTDAQSAEPTFTAPSPGRYTFQVSAGDGKISSIPATVDVFVATAGAALPVARLAPAPAPVALNVPVALDGSASTAGAGGALAYAWRQVSGPAAALADADRATASVVAFVPGSYVFELSVSEGDAPGVPVRVRLEARQNGQPIPVAAASAPGTVVGNLRTAIPGELVRLDGRGSTGAKHFRWTQVAGPWVALKANQAAPTFVPIAGGLYTFELEVDDGAVRSAPVPVSVLVSPAAP